MGISFMFAMELVGTIAFAASGALVAIHRGMDIFGVNVLAITTAVGGGVLRDVMIGKIPPKMFQNPVYVLVAALVANFIFCIRYFGDKEKKELHFINLYEKVMFWFDTLGLATFTVNGVSAGVTSDYGDNIFLIIFLGVITGVGGGVLRDMMANEMPYIFVKHIYACASLLGALAAGMLWHITGENGAVICGFLITILIRFLASHYRWDLPKI